MSPYRFNDDELYEEFTKLSNEAERLRVNVDNAVAGVLGL